MKNMEELREKAKSYAEENVINVLKEALAKVYVDGYRAGYNDCKKETPVDLCYDSQFVDLGLPSGTLWSVDYEKDGDKRMFLPYGKASEYRIPTLEQWKELQENCRCQYLTNKGAISGVLFVGPNGNILKFETTGRIMANEHIDSGHIFFWLQDEKEGNDKSVVHLQNGSCVEDSFCGYKLCIRQTKNSNI